MKIRNRKAAQEKEIQEIWDSYEYLFREKLVSMDNMCRAMIGEMKMFGVPDDMISNFVPNEFNRLWEAVAAEQCEKYDRKVRGA